MSWSGSCTIRGARSRNLRSIRLVHRSGGSTTCESAETGLNDRLILILPPITNAAGATSPASAILEFYLPRLGPHSPSRDHDLLTRVEVDSIAALQMEIAVEGALPSTERIESQRLRDPDIDSDHPAFHLFA